MRIFVDYAPCKECTNTETYGMVCVKCKECGRMFEDGICINIDDYPPYYSEYEED